MRTSDKTTLLATPTQGAAVSPGAEAKGARKKPKPYRWAVWVVSFLAFGIIAGVVGLLYFTVGSVSGSEFDAVYWTTREFRFARDPFTESQLTDVKHSTSRSFTVDPMIASHITGGPARPVHPRWDLVRIYRGLSSGEGEALILLRYLQADDSQGKNYWADWTTNHPKAAPVLWGAVRDAVHLERYDRLPEIFDQVRVDDDAKALKQSLGKVMLELALDEAQTRSKAGDRDAARRAALVGLSYGESDELQALVAETDADISTAKSGAENGAAAANTDQEKN